jgi:hypothetical protein
MPKSKTIEIDEIVTPEKSAGDAFGDQQDWSSSSPSGSTKKTANGSNTRVTGGEDPFANFRQSLPWKARITLSLTQWFVLLRSKSWGNFVIVPVVVLGVLLAIPLGLIAISVLIIRSIFSSRRY